MTVDEPLVTGPGAGAELAGPVGGPLRYVARAEQTSGRLTAIVNVIPPGTGPPLHRHDDQDETWWVVEGAVRFRLGDEEAEAATGAFVWVPRGLAHAFRNDAATPARLLVLFTPGGMESFFDGLAALDAIAPEDFARLGAAVGMTVVGPPLAPPGG